MRLRVGTVLALVCVVAALVTQPPVQARTPVVDACARGYTVKLPVPEPPKGIWDAICAVYDEDDPEWVLFGCFLKPQAAATRIAQ